MTGLRMTTLEAADYLTQRTMGADVTTQRLRSLRQTDYGPHCEKTGGQWTYDQSSLDDFMIRRGLDPANWSLGLADSEYTTAGAAAYLSQYANHTVSAKFLSNLRGMNRGPLAEKRGSRVIYSRRSLDAFLAEYGRNPSDWIAGIFEDVIRQLRTVGVFDPQLENVVRAFDPDGADDWRPEDASADPPPFE